MPLDHQVLIGLYVAPLDKATEGFLLIIVHHTSWFVDEGMLL
jgi:hypothetical protein